MDKWQLLEVHNVFIMQVQSIFYASPYGENYQIKDFKA